MKTIHNLRSALASWRASVWKLRFPLRFLFSLAVLSCWLTTVSPLAAGRGAFDFNGQGAPTQYLSNKGAAELRTMLNVAKLAAFPSERLTGFADRVAELYASIGYSLLWVRSGKLTPQGGEALERLRHAEEKGLNPDDYDGSFADFRFAPLEPPAHPSESNLIRLDRL